MALLVQTTIALEGTSQHRQFKANLAVTTELERIYGLHCQKSSEANQKAFDRLAAQNIYKKVPGSVALQHFIKQLQIKLALQAGELEQALKVFFAIQYPPIQLRCEVFLGTLAADTEQTRPCSLFKNFEEKIQLCLALLLEDIHSEASDR